ncbi:MAG: MlaD family protein [Thermodesulfobacteriota bacterium]|nr:MlaD family protein [Thermodesulfobacteriota bacterium]
MSNEVRVGIFVFIIIIIFIALSMKIGEISTNRKEAYSITLVFTSIEGLRIGAPVEMAGVKIGSVKHIALNKDYSATVWADIYKQVQLPVDTIASLGTKGVLGDKFIGLTPGRSKEIVPEGGKLLRAETPPSLDFLLTQLGEVSQNIAQLSESLNTALGGEEGMNRLNNIMNAFEGASIDVSEIISENKGAFSDVVLNLKEVSNNMVELSSQLGATARGLNAIASDVSSGHGTLGMLLTDDGLYLSLLETITNIQKVTSRMEENSTFSLLLSDDTLYYDLASAIDNLNVISSEIAAGRGALGRILIDDELYTEIKRAIKSVNQAAQGIKEQTPISVMGTVVGAAIR